MYIAYRLFEMLNRMGYTNAKNYKRQRHAFWNSLWLLHRGIMANGGRHLSGEILRVKHAFDVIEGRRRTRRIARSLSREVWRAWRIGRKKDPELYTPNNFFKSKYGNQHTLSLAFPRVRRRTRRRGLRRTIRAIRRWIFTGRSARTRRTSRRPIPTRGWRAKARARRRS
jgi:hypothetical protein